MKTALAKLIATVCGAGLFPIAPGTVGSLVALPLAWLLHYIGGFPLLLIATIVGFFKGWWATAVYTAQPGASEDPSEVVIDEVVGQWIALLPLSFGLWHAGVAPHVFPWPGVLGAFLFFRLFDISKPGPVGWADRRGDPLGVMLDDVIAGVFAGIVVLIGAGISHGVLGL
jgi:phosphatidylglycerophosphatase A